MSKEALVIIWFILGLSFDAAGDRSVERRSYGMAMVSYVLEALCMLRVIWLAATGAFIGFAA